MRTRNGKRKTVRDNRMYRTIICAALAIAGAQSITTAGDKDTGGVKVDKAKRTVTIDAKIAPRKLEYLKGEIYPLEVIACWPHPKGKKAHETIVTIDAKPSDVHKGLESLGLKAGKPVMGEGEPKGAAVNVYLLVNDSTGLPRKVTMDRSEEHTS